MCIRLPLRHQPPLGVRVCVVLICICANIMQYTRADRTELAPVRSVTLCSTACSLAHTLHIVFYKSDELCAHV